MSPQTLKIYGASRDGFISMKDTYISAPSYCLNPCLRSLKIVSRTSNVQRVAAQYNLKIAEESNI